MLKYYGCWEESGKLFLKMEFCMMNLRQRQKCKTQFKESELRVIIRDLAEILSYLHESRVVHLDVKPDNILLRNKNKKPQYILADYSIATQLEALDQQEDIIEGDARYLAPELLNFEQPKGLDLTSADVYSLGMTVFELMRGKHSFLSLFFVFFIRFFGFWYPSWSPLRK